MAGCNSNFPFFKPLLKYPHKWGEDGGLFFCIQKCFNFDFYLEVQKKKKEKKRKPCTFFQVIREVLDF